MLWNLAVTAGVLVGVLYVAANTVPGFVPPPVESIVAVIAIAVITGIVSAFSRRGRHTADTEVGAPVRPVGDGTLPYRPLPTVNAWAPARGVAAAGSAYSYHGREAMSGDRSLDHVVTF